MGVYDVHHSQAGPLKLHQISPILLLLNVEHQGAEGAWVSD